MSKSALLDLLPAERRKLVYHEEDGVTRIETRQEVSHIIRAAQLLADQPPGKDFRHAAFVPEAVLNQAFNQGWFHDPQAWKRWANDPANACYRTWKGKL